jgi:hypothetical protein
MKIFKVMATLCVICLAIGLSDVGSESFSGLFRAFAGVLFSASYITFVLWKSEHIHAEDIEPDYEHYYVPHKVAHEVGFGNW